MHYVTGKSACPFFAIEKRTHCFETVFKLSVLKPNPKSLLWPLETEMKVPRSDYNCRQLHFSVKNGKTHYSLKFCFSG